MQLERLVPRDIGCERRVDRRPARGFAFKLATPLLGGFDLTVSALVELAEGFAALPGCSQEGGRGRSPSRGLRRHGNDCWRWTLVITQRVVHLELFDGHAHRGRPQQPSLRCRA